MQDIAGIDVGARIRQHLASMGKTRAEGPQSEVPDRLFELGRYGQKTAAGWYRYEAGSRTPHPRSADRRARRRGGGRSAASRAGTISDDEILARITTALANEGARVLEEGFASAPATSTSSTVYGFGFPRHRGGPMFYAETVGLPAVLDRVKSTARGSAITGSRRRCSRRLVAEGRSFYDVGVTIRA